MLTQHCCFRFNSPNAPSENSQPVHHRGMRIRSNECIWIGALRICGTVRSGPYRLCKKLEVNLMANAGSRRDDTKVIERHLSPFQESVTFTIPLVLQCNISGKCLRSAKCVDDDRMVAHQIDRNQRADLAWITTKNTHSVTHCRQIDHSRHASEILHEDSGRPKGDLFACLAAILAPSSKGLDVGLSDSSAVLVAHQILQ